MGIIRVMETSLKKSKEPELLHAAETDNASMKPKRSQDKSQAKPGANTSGETSRVGPKKRVSGPNQIATHYLNQVF